MSKFVAYLERIMEGKKHGLSLNDKDRETLARRYNELQPRNEGNIVKMFVGEIYKDKRFIFDFRKGHHDVKLEGNNQKILYYNKKGNIEYES